MLNPTDLENAYAEFSVDLHKSLPDGVISVDIELLHSLNLLHTDLSDDGEIQESSYQFYVIETTEKLTLYNQDYIVWIIPRVINNQSSTLVLIALNTSPKPHLEMGYSASGVYNTSKLVLGVLNRFLNEITENQEVIVNIENDKKTGS